MTIKFSTINARAEEVDTKPAFREAFQRRRGLLPLDNFYGRKPQRVSSLMRSRSPIGA